MAEGDVLCLDWECCLSDRRVKQGFKPAFGQRTKCAFECFNSGINFKIPTDYELNRVDGLNIDVSSTNYRFYKVVAQPIQRLPGAQGLGRSTVYEGLA